MNPLLFIPCIQKCLIEHREALDSGSCRAGCAVEPALGEDVEP